MPRVKTGIVRKKRHKKVLEGLAELIIKKQMKL